MFPLPNVSKYIPNTSKHYKIKTPNGTQWPNMTKAYPKEACIMMLVQTLKLAHVFLQLSPHLLDCRLFRLLRRCRKSCQKCAAQCSTQKSLSKLSWFFHAFVFFKCVYNCLHVFTIIDCALFCITISWCIMHDHAWPTKTQGDPYSFP